MSRPAQKLINLLPWLLVALVAGAIIFPLVYFGCIYEGGAP